MSSAPGVGFHRSAALKRLATATSSRSRPNRSARAATYHRTSPSSYAELLFGVPESCAVPHPLLVHGGDGAGLAQQAEEGDGHRVGSWCGRLVGLEGCLLVLAEVHDNLLSGFPTCAPDYRTLVCIIARQDRRISRQRRGRHDDQDLGSQRDR